MDIKKRPNYKIYLQVLRQMSPKKRLLKAFELSEFTRQLFIHGLHQRFPIDQSRFLRKIEDTILAKLRWAKLSGGSEKQFTDALRVYEVQYSMGS